ncbi:MAG: peptide chain release factor N(5)-glutamine methyltransferase [Hyphomicrobiales bacterium]|nr:peptide chain release factor N(5)-glutamine methyltransferase [Hyphomicrobiales bacterium]
MTDRSIGALRRRIARQLAGGLAARGCNGTPDLDARLLVAHALQCDPGGLVLRDDEAVRPEQWRMAVALGRARIAGAPVARLLGKKPFWNLTLDLTDDTLVPRPDTETVVAAALAVIDAGRLRSEPLSILDLGTGTGAILLALLSELPTASGAGFDISEGAVRTAQANAARAGLSDRAVFAVGDWHRPIGARFDIVVSNPPYIASVEMAGLPVEVAQHDPHIALDGGPDGLAAHRIIAGSMGEFLRRDGHAFLEIGRGQAAAVAELGRRQGLTSSTHRDLAGIERVVELRRGENMGLEIDRETARVRSPQGAGEARSGGHGRGS